MADHPPLPKRRKPKPKEEAELFQIVLLQCKEEDGTYTQLTL